MRGGWLSAAALGAGLFLFAGACTPIIGQNTNRTASISPAASPSPSPTASPTAPPTPATVSGFPLPGGEVALAYSGALSANGGTSPYTWSLMAGALPGGLNLGQDGSVTGTPTIPGTFTFSVQVADKNNASSTASGSIKVYPRLVASLIPACASACSVEQGCVNVCGNFGTQSGGMGPYKYAASGNIPKGETLNGLSLAGSFPSLAQYWQFDVTVTDALGATASITPTFYVFKHIAIAAIALCRGNYNVPCSVRIPYSGGTPGRGPSVKVVGFGVYCPGTFCYPKPSSVPPSFSSTASGGYVTISVDRACGYPGVSGCPSGWGGIVYIDLVDQNACGTPTNCTSNTSAVSIDMAGG